MDFTIMRKKQFTLSDEKFQSLEKNYDDSLALFGETSAQMAWEEYFEIWDSFITSYLIAERRVEDEEKLAEKEKKRKEWLESQQKAKAEKGVAKEGAKKTKIPGKKKKKKKQLYDNVKDVIKGNDSDAIFTKQQRMRKERKKKENGGDPNAPRTRRPKTKDDGKKRQQIKEILALSGIKKTKTEVKTPIPGVPGNPAEAVSPPKKKKPSSKKAPNYKIPARTKAPHEIPPCKECACKEYNAHPFKPNYCNKCYHNHM